MRGRSLHRESGSDRCNLKLLNNISLFTHAVLQAGRRKLEPLQSPPTGTVKPEQEQVCDFQRDQLVGQTAQKLDVAKLAEVLALVKLQMRKSCNCDIGREKYMCVLTAH